MADVFTSADATALLKDKVVIFIGDSNIRSLYKDLLWLLKDNTLININCLRRKLERSYLGDSLVRSSSLTKSRDFFEERTFKGSQHYLKFFFVTRCYCETLVKFMTQIIDGVCPTPDVIIMNSCVWDINRWGPNGVEEYKVNMVKLMELLRVSLPPRTMFIWTTALPMSVTIRGGLIIKQIEFMERSMRFHIMEANLFARNLVNSYGFDVVDLHYHIQYQISRRSCDGIHYLPLPVRLQTNLLLTHIALTWGRELPRKGDVMFVDHEIDLASSKTKENYWAECFNALSPNSRKEITADGSNSQINPHRPIAYPVQQSINAVTPPRREEKASSSRSAAKNNGTIPKIPLISLIALSPCSKLRPPPDPWQSQYHPAPVTLFPRYYEPYARLSENDLKKMLAKRSAKSNKNSAKKLAKNNTQQIPEKKSTVFTGTNLIVTVPVPEAMPQKTCQTQNVQNAPQQKKKKKRNKGKKNLKRLQRNAYSNMPNRMAINTGGNAVNSFLKSTKRPY